MNRLQIEGKKDLLESIAELAQAYPQAASAALLEEGYRVDANMVPRIPVDTGRMRSTHYVAPPMVEPGGEIVVEVGVATDYAVAVHERTEVNHPVGEAKFLERALFAEAAGMAPRLAKRIPDLAARGVGVSAIPRSAPEKPRVVSSRSRRKKNKSQKQPRSARGRGRSS